ncbi:hypothetical protein XOC_2332 [Xanthomonas oryzae pv. oryzicola BLS256]|uniref:Uncharacterized protein n=1 Tax=Xanthomonas oryzae pv. oryzicola (strain BLS256) TaxID=383407 RepID=G7TEV1_XANOB|nr:hypothetical protein XOC_2332 [Xanthomonas oryzae pv. oryzicola BLS256]QEO97538.1 hypothetical protein XOCgx_2548 [Xanthomonas oryzae pv. oryzicola]
MCPPTNARRRSAPERDRALPARPIAPYDAHVHPASVTPSVPETGRRSTTTAGVGKPPLV